MPDLDGELTELLRDMRHQAGLTGGELGVKLNLPANQGASNSYIAAYVDLCERGEHKATFELFGRWAAACGFSAELVVKPRKGAPWVVALNDGPQP
jgi:hypothetical protein